MNEPNGRRISRRALLAGLIVAAGSCSCVETTSRPLPKISQPAGPAASERNAGLVEAHNVERARFRLPGLVEEPRLTAAAAEHAADMAARGKMSHKGGDGSSPFERMSRVGYTYSGAAENVAYGFPTVEAVMAGWMRSPGHRRNILGQYSQVGVGYATGKDGLTYWCVTFGTPSGR
jgi:uncharacterized protein YkwD